MDHHPCGICGVHVLETDEAIECDGQCSLWHHRECLAMTLDVYLKLSRGQDDWVCKKCTIKHQAKLECATAERPNPVNEIRKPTMDYEKLDKLEGRQKCIFCHTTEIDDIKYGPVYKHKNIITHYYCLLLSSNMEQNGRDDEGILGFMANDINKEVKRGRRLYCSFCKSGGATLGCAIAKCKVVFHLTCGIKHGTLHQFFGEFKSFCAKHRPVQKINEKILAESSKGAMCGICYEKVIPRPIHETLWAPCCKKSAFFHRDCVQKLAISAGYFFKCPLCNNTTTFQQAMKEYGVYIPEQDASWERVPQAYQDLLVRHDQCDKTVCTCPSGRKTNVSGTRWELILCKFCGSQGMHIGCGRLKWKSPEFECNICSGIDSEQADGNTQNYNGNRHRISGRTSALLPPDPDENREEGDSEYSSGGDDNFTISNSRSRKKCVSPPLERKIKSPSPPPSKKSKHEKTRKKSANSAKVSETVVRIEREKSDSTSILVVDDSDDDLEVISVSNLDSGFVKDRDGRSIPVVQVKGKQKRPRVENDLQILPDEIVDITIQRPGHTKKSKSLTPPPMEEVVYSLRPPQPSTSTTFSQPQPSTSFAQPSDLNRFVLVDPNTLRPEDLPPGTMLYRSVRPVMNVPQASNVPMQQLGVPGDAVTKHPDICEHRSRLLKHFSSQHICQRTKKLSRSNKCNCPGRRRRGRRCDINRLNPQVILSPLKLRRSADGYYEILITKRKLSFDSTKKRKASPLPAKPLKKMKIESNDPSKRKTTHAKKEESNIKKYAHCNNFKNMYKKKINSNSSKHVYKKSLSFQSGLGILNYFKPSNNKVNKRKENIKAVKLHFVSKRKTNILTDISNKPTKKSKICSLEWKFKKIEEYLKKKPIKYQPSLDKNIHSNDASYISVKEGVTHIINHVSVIETPTNSGNQIVNFEESVNNDQQSVVEQSNGNDHIINSKSINTDHDSSMENPKQSDHDLTNEISENSSYNLTYNPSLIDESGIAASKPMELNLSDTNKNKVVQDTFTTLIQNGGIKSNIKAENIIQLDDKKYQSIKTSKSSNKIFGMFPRIKFSPVNETLTNSDNINFEDTLDNDNQVTETLTDSDNKIIHFEKSNNNVQSLIEQSKGNDHIKSSKSIYTDPDSNMEIASINETSENNSDSFTFNASLIDESEIVTSKPIGFNLSTANENNVLQDISITLFQNGEIKSDVKAEKNIQMDDKKYQSSTTSNSSKQSFGLFPRIKFSPVNEALKNSDEKIIYFEDSCSNDQSFVERSNCNDHIISSKSIYTDPDSSMKIASTNEISENTSGSFTFNASLNDESDKVTSKPIEINLSATNKNQVVQDIPTTLFQKGEIKTGIKAENNIQFDDNKNQSNQITKSSNQIFGFFPRIKFSGNAKLLLEPRKKNNAHQLKPVENRNISYVSGKENKRSPKKLKKANCKTPLSFEKNNRIIENYFYPFNKDSSGSGNCVKDNFLSKNTSKIELGNENDLSHSEDKTLIRDELASSL